jgi:iron complex outermembrane receptor protein
MAGSPGPYPVPVNVRVSGLNGGSATFEDTLTDWRLAVDYGLTDSSIVYASASTGYKSGGVNQRPFFAEQLQTFEPETITSYEFGYKSTLLDNALRFNAAVFFNEYDDIQLTLSECERPAALFPTPIGAPCAKPANVGNADIKGLELEAEYYFSEDFFIDASWSTLDFEYTYLDPVALGGTSINPYDMISPYTPETSWSLGVQWGTSTSLGRVNARIDASFQDDIYTNAANGPLNEIESYTMTNARLWWVSPTQDWEVAMEVMNVADKLYYQTLFDQANSVGQVTGTPGLPLTWRISAKRSF